MSIFHQWRNYLLGTQAENPQIGKLDHLNRFPKDLSIDGEKDERWQEFADDVEKAVRDLNAEFFQDLADAARELRSGPSVEREAIHWATLIRRCAGDDPSNLVKGEIREEIVELWANQFSKDENGPSAEDWSRARMKESQVNWPRIWKKSGLSVAAKKPKSKREGG
ncbi:MAG: hypothetical protein P1U58_20265 [Verrucomicrobiales bacterium]|nr:hypothetical protein [Verrucomicrobiales bacterium]